MKQKYTKRAMRNLGLAVLEARRALEMTQKDFGELAGVSGGTVSAWERSGVIHEPHWDNLQNAAGWPVGTVNLFLTGVYRDIEDITEGEDGNAVAKPNEGGGYAPALPDEEDSSEPEPEHTPEPFKSEDKRSDAKRNLAILLNRAMNERDTSTVVRVIEVRVPVYWDLERANAVVRGATKLAQEAIDAYAAQHD